MGKRETGDIDIGRGKSTVGKELKLEHYRPKNQTMNNFVIHDDWITIFNSKLVGNIA